MLHGWASSLASSRAHRRQRYAEWASRTAVPRISPQVLRRSDAARTWAAAFVRWYNVEHRHSGIRYVTPAQRHAGDDHEILAARHALYVQARDRNPARWARTTRNWSPVGPVTLNPERDSVISTALATPQKQPMAA